MQNRKLMVISAVVAAHAGGLWLLQQGLVQRPAENLVPAEILVEWVARSQPIEAPAIKPQAPVPRPVELTPKTAQSKPAPLPIKAPTHEPAPLAATASPTSEPSAPPMASQTATTQTPIPAQAPAPAAPTPPRVELPSANAQYLNNPQPAYPPLSKRLGEEGKVVLRVLIETDGTASQAEIRTSSGYERLDQTALQTVLRWRYVPGKRNGVAEAMWFNVPINFVLE